MNYNKDSGIYARNILLLLNGRKLAIHGEGVDFTDDLSGVLVNFGVAVGKSNFIFEGFLRGFLRGKEEIMEEFQEDQNKPSIFQRLKLNHEHVEVITTRSQNHKNCIAQYGFNPFFPFRFILYDIA